MALLLAGCIGQTGDDGDLSDGAGPAGTGDGAEGTGGADGTGADAPDAGPGPTAAPVLAEGTKLTYRGEGLFNVDGTFSIVVQPPSPEAPDGGEGYLFAAAGPADLLEEVVWDRVWFGPQDASLNPVVGGESPPRLFDFPLEDGKTWQWDGRPDWPVEARSADVALPDGGTEPGFEMTMDAGGQGTRWTWTYAPSVGYVTRLTSADDGATYYDLTLESVDRADGWTWFEPATDTTGVCAGGDGPAGQATLTVSGASSVVISTGILGRGTAAVTPPPTSQMGPVTWLWPQPSDDWGYDLVDGADGDWTLAAASPDTYACAFARAVTWTGP